VLGLYNLIFYFYISGNAIMKVREVIKLMEKDGWYLARTKSSHRQYKHPYKKGLVTISGHLNEDIAKGTLNSILKQAGLKKVEEDV
jgi:predicted RNA binding protein YcfA (HicA-like mRNA interferase family)